MFNLKTLKFWQVVVLLVVMVGSGGGVYSWRHAAASAKPSALPANTQLVAVKLGNVVNSVSASGTLAFTNKTDLTFGSASTVLEVNVQQGETVKKGQVLAKIDAASLQRSVIQSRLNLTTAEINLTKAQNPYTQIDLDKASFAVPLADAILQKAQQSFQDSQTTDLLVVAFLQAAADLAQANLLKAQADLATLQAAPSATDVAKAQAAVDQAAAQLQKAYADLATAVSAVPQNYTQIQLAQADVQTKILNLQTVQDNQTTVLAGPDSLTMAKGRASVSQAQVSLRQAQEDLQKAQTPDPVTVAQMQANVAIAQGNLAQAQETLNTVKAGADPNDVAAKQLQRDSAKANLDDIQTQLASATMVAPLEGAVSAVNIKAGQNVTANAIAISIVDTSAPEISAFVSEADISRVKQGQSARVTLDSLPGVSVSGSVASVGLVGRTSSGVVSYPITVRVTPPQGAVVREGMTASVTLVVQQMSNVMVVPNRAIGGSTRNPTVTVMVNGVAQETPVTLGLADDSNTEVKSGIKQGDMVVVSTSGAASRQGFFNSGGGGIGGAVIPGLPGGR